MNESKETIAVDANPLFSALRGGRAKSVLYSDKLIFITTEYTTWEVKKYIPEMSVDTGVPESELFYAFDCFPIISTPPEVYDGKRQHAENLISHRDPKDVDILALALKLNIPIWTNDRDFDNLPEIKTFTTAAMLAKLVALTD
jgi:predicted nucleic acid-binding protein